MITSVTRRKIGDLFQAYRPEPETVGEMLNSSSSAGFLDVFSRIYAPKAQRPKRPLAWWGILDEIQFLERLFDLDTLTGEGGYESAHAEIGIAQGLVDVRC